MDAGDLAIRNATYRLFAERAGAPSVGDVATALTLTATDVAAAWLRLHDDHALVLDDDTSELLMANPFSAVPTPYRVDAGGRSWYANCAWDAFGVCAALDVDGHIDATCADCGAAIACDVVERRPRDPTLVFHCLVPAAHWWDDIVFT